MVANDNNMEILQYVMWKIKELFITRLIMNDYDVTDFIEITNITTRYNMNLVLRYDIEKN